MTEGERTLIVRPLAAEEVTGARYDLVIASIGFERRARFAAKRLQPTARSLCASAFPDRHVLAFESNVRWYKQAGYRVEEVPDSAYAAWCSELVASALKESERPRLFVDISSTSRLRLALLIDSLRKSGDAIEAHFIYVLARFSPPPAQDGPTLHAGPVTHSFAGWTREPDIPPAAVVGLGYEHNKALGAVELMQAGDVWLLEPQSPIARYDGAVRAANRVLLEEIPMQRRLTYSVEHPFDTFVRLESLVYGCLRSTTPILLPFGPKIFALLCLLVGCQYPLAAVWRVSGGEAESPKDRLPTEWVFGLAVRF